MLLLDLLFPKFCVGCKKWGKYICNNCRKDIELLEFYVCPICSKRTQTGLIHTRCGGNSYIDGVVSSMKYNQIAKKLVKAIKYQLIYDIYKELFDLIFQTKLTIFNEFYKNYSRCYFLPIPLHTNRFKMRGFNQAEELTKLFSKKFQYPVLDSLVRIRDTKQQAQIHHKNQRLENIKGAFIIKEKQAIVGKTIILVDDVYTSGSTCSEAAKTLRECGAFKVFVWSLARD